MKSHTAPPKLSLQAVISFAVIASLLIVAVPVFSQSSLYQEAPMLVEQVRAGKLPSIDKRLPSNPVVVQPEQNVGTYGGTWHMAIIGDDRALLGRTMGYEGLVRWDSQWTHVIPNLAQSYTVNSDATEYVFHLREGLRWSDGELFTADDIVFWYQAVFLNKDLDPSPLPWLLIGGKPVDVQKQDTYTVVFRFAAPNGLFLQRLATADAARIVNYPRHYYAQFHPDYNPNVADLVAKEGVKTWVDLFQKKAPYPNFTVNWEEPTLNAWMLTSDYFSGSGVVDAVRNPYYWKVDTEFNQLPYIDHVEFVVVKDANEVNALAIKGQIDMESRSINAVVADPKNMQAGGYSVFKGISSNSSSVVISLNMNDADPIKRAIFQNRDFRIGLSYAINRAKLSNLGPFQAAPVPESPLYSDRLATQYTQYDVQKANQYLDQAGYKDRDTDGFRLGPDGKRISIKFTVSSSIPNTIDPTGTLTQVQSDWQAVGIEMSVETLARQATQDRWAGNQFDATIWSGDGGYDVILEPRYYFPYSNYSLFALTWARWFVNPKDPLAEEPPQIVKQQMQLYNQLQGTGDLDKQIAIMKQILDIAADQFYAIGINRLPTAYGVVKNNFHNVPSVMPFSFTYPDPGPTNPCQYYIDG